MESCWKEDLRNSSVTLFVAISQVLTWYLCASGRCMGVCRAMALIGNARQAMSEGKSGLVEAGLTGPAATALSMLMMSENITCKISHVFVHSVCNLFLLSR